MFSNPVYTNIVIVEKVFILKLDSDLSGRIAQLVTKYL